MDQRRWINSWAPKTWLLPCVHGDFTLQVPSENLPSEGTFFDRVDAISSSPLVENQYCFTHGRDCPTRSQFAGSDLDFSGLPCEENSRANTKRKFLSGRFANLYAIWGKRHKTMKTPLLILENTPETRQQYDSKSLNLAQSARTSHSVKSSR